jgi:hypothetical protein
MDRSPTSKQVAFAEKLARIKRRAVPEECFRNKELMSKWIDGNRLPEAIRRLRDRTLPEPERL